MAIDLNLKCMWPRYSYNVIAALHDGRWQVEKLDKLPEGVQPQISVQELLECEKIVKGSKRVQELAAEVGEYNSFFWMLCIAQSV